MKELKTKIAFREGMNAREVALCVQRASAFKSDIYLQQGEKRMNAKSLMGMMALGLVKDDVITVQADGEDEEHAVQEMKNYFEGN